MPHRPGSATRPDAAPSRGPASHDITAASAQLLEMMNNPSPSEEDVRILLEAGADPNAVQPTMGASYDAGCTPFHIAVVSGRAGLIRLLLEKGANISSRKKDDGETPLITAVRIGRTDIIGLMLEAGGDVNASDDDGTTALMYAATHTPRDPDRAVDIATLLLAAGADPHARDANGNTALHWAAARRGNTDLGALLVARGADPTALNNAGETPDRLCSESAAAQAVFQAWKDRALLQKEAQSADAQRPTAPSRRL